MNKDIDLKVIKKNLQNYEGVYEHLSKDVMAQIYLSIQITQKLTNELKERAQKKGKTDEADSQIEAGENTVKTFKVVAESFNEYAAMQKKKVEDTKGELQPVRETTELPLGTNRPTEQYDESTKRNISTKLNNPKKNATQLGIKTRTQ